MLRKIIAVLLLVASLSAFLVVFGGFALLDITIKLMWLSFSTIVAFAASSLGVNLSQSLVNRLLRRQHLLPGSLQVLESPIITKDKIILCNLVWLDEQGHEKMSIHQVELRTTLMAIFLALLHGDREARVLQELKEIVLQQPQLSLSYQLEGSRQLHQDLAQASPQLLHPGLQLPRHLKLYVERGLLTIRINEQLLRLENVHGIWRNEPVAYHYLSCQLDDENITLQNQNGTDRYLIRANKLPLKQFWPLLRSYIQLEKLDFIDGELSDCKSIWEQREGKWTCSALSWQVNDLAINSNGLLIEDIEGKFSSLDLRLFQIKKLDFSIANHSLRLNGTLNLLPPGQKGCIYKLRLRSEKLYLKSNIDVNIFDGFKIQGFLRQEKQHLLAATSIDGLVRLDLPQQKTLKFSQFQGTIDLYEGVLCSKEATCYVNDSQFTLSDSLLNLQTEDFLLHLAGDDVQVALILDEHLQGAANFNLTVAGNLKDQSLQAQGIYHLQEFTYKFKFLPYTPKANLNGRLSYEKGQLLLKDNHLNLSGYSLPLPFTLQPLKNEEGQGYSLNLQDKLSELKSLILQASLGFKNHRSQQEQAVPQQSPAPLNTKAEEGLPVKASPPDLLQQIKKQLPFWKS